MPFTKSYGGATVLTMPSVELKPGTVTAVIGANGSGKSTLAKVLAGLEPADKKTRAELEARVGYLPQKSFAFRMSLRRNIALNGADAKRAAQLTEALGLSSLLKRSAKRLSGGETAKMALARLLMADYDVLILDEPTAAMDMESTLAAEQLITGACAETGCAVLLITLAVLKHTQKKTVLKKLWWKFWLLGFLADFIGAVSLFGCWYLSLLPDPVGSWIDSIISQAFLNPFRTLPGFLYTLAGVAAAGVCIYFFDKRAMKSCTLLDGRQRHIIALTMAIVTAPWTFLIPLYNY